MATVMVMANTASNKRVGPSWALLLIFVQGAAWAGDWQARPRISLTERYSDNINLQADGMENSEWVTTITPGFSLSRKGGGLTFSADYNMMGLLYANDSNLSRARHSLNAQASAEMLEDWFFLDASARISQELSNYLGGIGMGDAAGISNTSQVYSYSLSPYLKHRFASFATVEARMSPGGVWNGGSNVTDSRTTSYRLSASSGADFLPVSWTTSYDRMESDNSITANTDSERGSVHLRLPLRREFGLVAQAGVERTNFAGASNRIRDYSHYGLGVTYTPGRRFSAEVYYNDSDHGGFVSGNIRFSPTNRTTFNASSTQRNFGRSYTFQFGHHTRHTRWGFTYHEDLTTSQRQYLERVGVTGVYLCPGNIIEPQLPDQPPSDPACIPALASLFSQAQLNDTYIAKNLAGTVSHTLRRSNLTLSVYDNHRGFQSTNTSDRSHGLQASWSLRAGARTTFTLSGGLSRIDTGVAGVGDDDLWNMRLVATRRFQPKVSGSVELRHQERSSSRVGGDFAENSVAAGLNVSF